MAQHVDVADRLAAVGYHHRHVGQQPARRAISPEGRYCGSARSGYGRNEAFGDAYQDNGLVFCWEDSRPIYPDTVTERFNRLVKLAQLPLIRLHDVRRAVPAARH
jgi:hypothetical protein